MAAYMPVSASDTAGPGTRASVPWWNIDSQPERDWPTLSYAARSA